MKSIAQRQAEGITPIFVKSGGEQRLLLETSAAYAKDKVCDDCLSDIWPAWYEGTWQLRCLQGFAPKIIKKNNQLSIRGGQTMLERRPDLPAVYEPGQALTVMPEQRPMTIEEFKGRQELVKYVVGEMEEGIHYGRIPGTKDLSLWEPGAEYLRAAFNIQWDYTMIEEREDFREHEYYYRYRVFQLLGPGVTGPGWETSAWSKERKFWCKAGDYNDSCPKQCDGDHPPKGMEAAMLSHNVRDRSLKRGFVAMIRNVTGTTGYFKQALDVQDSNHAADELPAGGGNDHPWLVTCPIHNQKWFKRGNMPELAHRYDNDSKWCNQSRTLKPMIDEQLKEIVADSWEKKDVDSFLKANFGGTWSTLSPKVQLDAIEKLKTTPPPGTQEPTASDGNPVDTETGEIQATPPGNEGVPTENRGSTAGMGESDPGEH